MPVRKPFYQEFNSTTKPVVDRRYYHNCIFDNHYHMNPELVYVYAGELTAMIRSVPMTIRAGQFCLVLPWQLHAYSTEETSDAMIIVFPAKYIQLFTQKMSSYHGHTQVFTVSEPILSLFQTWLFDPQAQPDEYVFSSVLYGLCHHFKEQCPCEDANQEPESNLETRMMNYISAHCHEAISLKDLSDHFGYSYHYISHMFQENTGLSFHLFRNIQRVTRAAALLEDEKLSISEIAWRCGFQNIRTFNRVFLQLMGQSPSSYREEVWARDSRISVFPSDLYLKPDAVSN